MKKIMILALVAMVATCAFAQNPEALKQIKKAKTAEDVAALIETNEATMTAAENAQAYNKLVDIYAKGISEAETAIQTNELQKQMGQEPKEKVDMDAYYKSLEGALAAALLCDKYDAQPDDKGKVAPKFRKGNGDRLATSRPQLLNAAADAQDNDDSKKAAALYQLYVDTGTSPLFANQIAAAAAVSPNGIGDPYLSEVARVASLNAFNSGDLDTAARLTDVMLQDPEKLEDAITLKIYYMSKDLYTREDSLRCLEQMKEMYAVYPNIEEVFLQLANMYGNLGQDANQLEVINKALQSNPDSFSAWALKGQVEMNAQDYDAAIADLTKALSCESKDPGQRALVDTFVGFCYSQKAAQLEIYEQQKEVLKEAIPFLEAARELDPERDRCNWAYPLYNCYYHIKGESDPATEELRILLGL